MKWWIGKNRCRHNYRCCRKCWLAVPPGDDGEGAGWSYEFDTWGEALAFVNHELANLT